MLISLGAEECRLGDIAIISDFRQKQGPAKGTSDFSSLNGQSRRNIASDFEVSDFGLPAASEL